jgi:hypothetical protein
MTQKLSKEAHSNKVKYNNNYNKKMIECQCGGKTSYAHLARHKTSKKHLSYIDQKK